MMWNRRKIGMSVVCGCLSFFSLSAQSLSRLIKRPADIIESKWETNSAQDQCLNYYNNDYCDYYVYRQNDRSYNLAPGKNTIFKIAKDSNFDNPFKNPSSYSYYRGIFVRDFDITFPYALPVKNGEKTAWKIDLRERMKTLNFYMQEGDTVYATRGGVACTTYSDRLLLVYHADHSFAAYLVMDQCFISAGDHVRTGQPVGIAGPTGVSISYFFLDENKFEYAMSSGYAYSHFVPYFRTTEGDIQLEEKKLYEAVVDDDLVTKEMTKREKKKYMKQKGL